MVSSSNSEPMTPEAEIAALVEAARDVVANYPVAAGTSKGMTDGDGPGYGSIKRLALALASLSAAKPVPVDAGGWIVLSGDGKRYRTWKNGWSAWTEVRDEATRYARREDAEAVHAEDEDAWTIVPYRYPAPAPEGEADHAR